jgi:hypothetical protein
MKHVISFTAALLLATLSAAPLARADDDGSPSEKKTEPEFKRLTFDLGGSSNFNNGSSAYEAHLGINLNILSWLTWRNAPFYRSQSGVDPQYGLDTSLNGHYEIPVSKEILPKLTIGGGYRLDNAGSNDAPFIEGGLGGSYHGLGGEASVKRLFHSVMTTGLADETLYTLNFTGSLNL